MNAMIVAARRTPIRSVRARGRAAENQEIWAAEELAAQALAAVADDAARAGFGAVSEVVLGSARPASGNLARRAALAAGLGVEVPAVTLDRQCGSGLDAVRVGAALSEAAGGSDSGSVVLAAGAESVSEAGPDQAAFTPSGFADPDLAQAADDLAAQLGITRERQDAYTVRSYRLAHEAANAGWFDAELVPIPPSRRGPRGEGHQLKDDRPRQVNAAVLGRLPAHRGPGGVTRANIAGVADAAAAVAMVSSASWRRNPVPGLQFRGGAVVGVDPAEPGIGAAAAIERLLDGTGVRLAEVAVVEIVEAFAAQQLACLDRLNLDPFGNDAHRVSPSGGALGLGHPWGASGAIAMVRLFGQLVRQDAPVGTLGIVAAAVAGGQGVATLWERL